MIGLKIYLSQKLIKICVICFHLLKFWEHYIDNKCWTNSIFEDDDDDDDDDDDFETGKKIDKKNKNKKEINIDIELKETTNDIFKSYEKFCKEYKFYKENQSPNIRAFNGRLID